MVLQANEMLGLHKRNVLAVSKHYKEKYVNILPGTAWN